MIILGVEGLEEKLRPVVSITVRQKISLPRAAFFVKIWRRGTGIV